MTGAVSEMLIVRIPCMVLQAASMEQLERAVGTLDLEPTERQITLRHIRTNTVGLMLYGSRARGDYLSSSDFDLLRLSLTPHRTFKVGRVSVSSYSLEQLQSADRTLFGTHLLRDGKVLFDIDGVLKSVIGGLAPADPDELLTAVHRYSAVLNQPETEKARHYSGLVRLARYLLRTAVYARAMKQGVPCFSVRELAERFNDPALITVLASDPDITGPPSLVVLSDLISRLTAIVGQLAVNTFGSLEALAVGMWDSDRNIAALAVRASSDDEEEFDYSDLPKVLL